MIETPVRKRLFTVDEYYRMAQTGILSPSDRVELIQGEIVAMSPIGPRHASIVSRLIHLFQPRVGERAIVTAQSPVHLDTQSEPEPDLMLLHPRDDFYAGAHPRPSDVLLLIEVADSSLAYDRDVKSVLYAAVGIGEFWLIDLVAERIIVHRQPTADCFRQMRIFLPGEQIAPQAIPDLSLPVAEILGR
ncbi:MAG: Uma2 family endonuclease [Chloroflexota bacterium]